MAIREVIRLRSSSSSNEFTRVLTKLSVVKMVDLFLNALVPSTSSILSALMKGDTPTSAAVSEARVVMPSSDFNVAGVYLHVGRNGASPFSQGLYVGSASGETPDSNAGCSNMVGILRRIVCQHGSPRYRAYENAKRSNGVPHYRLYHQMDTAANHTYYVTHYLLDEELRGILSHGSVSDHSTAHEQRLERAAVVKIIETTVILLVGAFNHDQQVNRVLVAHGWLFSPSNIIKLNRSVGLEFASETYDQFKERCSRGGQNAQYTFARLVGLPSGSRISLSAYMLLTRSDPQDTQSSLEVRHAEVVQRGICVLTSAQGARRGGFVATFNERHLRWTCLEGGIPFQVSLTVDLGTNIVLLPDRALPLSKISEVDTHPTS